MSLKKLGIFVILLFTIAAVSSAQTTKRPLKIDDLLAIKDVRDPQVSPDGNWVAYVLSTTDAKADKASTDIWMISFDGKTTRRVTFSLDNESSPRWSPDGKFLSFTSSRPGPNKGGQIWLLDLSGGEARQLTDIKGSLQDYAWSPDSKRIAMVIGDPDPEADGDDGGKPKTPKPIVIDRYKFKQDREGYLSGKLKSYVYLFDIAAKKTERLTKGKFNESSPVWSPDGGKIAFTSNHQKDPDRDPTSQIFVAESKANVVEKQITPDTSRGGRGGHEWSPDGKMIAFVEAEEIQFDAYNMDHLTLVAADGSSAPTRFKPTEDLDRGVGDIVFTADGKSIYFTVVDNRSVYPAKADLSGGKVSRLIETPIVLGNWHQSNNRIATISGGDSKANEIYAFESGKLRQLTHHNDELFAGLDIPPTEGVCFPSKDGTEVCGLLTYPVGYVKGSRVPTLLRIHGGPNGQDQHSFAAERQYFAANGYAVLAVNYRGSSGRGMNFSHKIAADWGNFEVQDLLAGVDHVVKMGVADPDKLGVGGWSYGGILTDYMIASDNRFKAGTSGAGTAFTVSYYGTDQYIIQYDNEIGPPWEPKAWATYQKLSYPFLNANKIKTPTLFLGGESDFNVPISGSEQMYQALKSLGIDTQLIIYPKEFHGISRPTYRRDLLERYLGWYDKYVRKITPEPKSPIAAWEGKWKGKLVNIPAKLDVTPVEVEREIGAFPTANNTCSMFKTTYSELGVVKQVKDYKICRGTGADDIYIDEGNGVKLTAKVVGDSLISPFKYGNILLISTMRLRGDTLEEEILTVDDKPATMGVQPMNAKGIQRIELKRVVEKE
jgi:dipeptidyl aminopeptidase/acylaminoacyl peptidase